MAQQFGIATTPTGGYGLIQSYEESDTVEIAESVDASGNVEDIQAYKRKVSVKVEYVYDVGVSKPTAGGTLTIGSDGHTITSVTEVESNEGFTTLAIEAYRTVDL